jgi:hypothetical protein
MNILYLLYAGTDIEIPVLALIYQYSNPKFLVLAVLNTSIGILSSPLLYLISYTVKPLSYVHAKDPKISFYLIMRSLYLTWFVLNNEVQQYRKGPKFFVLNNKVYLLKRFYCIEKKNCLKSLLNVRLSKYLCLAVDVYSACGDLCIDIFCCQPRGCWSCWSQVNSVPDALAIPLL